MINVKEQFDHGMYCHCSDYDPDICTDECFRARLTKDLKESGYSYPVSFGNFRQSGEFCMLHGYEEKKGIEDG